MELFQGVLARSRGRDDVSSRWLLASAAREYACRQAEAVHAALRGRLAVAFSQCSPLWSHHSLMCTSLYFHQGGV